MAKKSKNRLPTDIQEATQRVLHAGVGALSVTEKKGSKLFKKLVKKGKRYDGVGLEQVEQMRQSVQDLSENLDAAERTFGVEAVKAGGGWYEIRLQGLVVRKVQGQDAADAAVAELEAQR